MSNSEAIPIVVLPGMDGTGELLTDFLAHMSKARSVQVVSYPTDRELTYDDLEALVCEQLPNERFVLLGESFSGPLAIEIAATHEHVSGLVLASSFARHPLPSRFTLLSNLVPPNKVPSAIIRFMLLGITRNADLHDQLTRVLAKIDAGVMRLRVSEVLTVDKRHVLPNVSCPILCLHGRRDRLVRQRHVDEIVDGSANSRVEWLDAPHILLETCPDVSGDIINKFCEQVSLADEGTSTSD